MKPGFITAPACGQQAMATPDMAEPVKAAAPSVSVVRKPTVLILAEVYLPGFLGGGPVRSIVNMVERLGTEFEFKILTTDRDFHADAPYEGIVSGRWIRVGKADVFYASPDWLTPQRLKRLLRSTSHDVLYLNSFFSLPFSIVPLVARWLERSPAPPVLIAPRGEFSRGAYALKSWKKRPFVWITRRSGLYTTAHWHASTSYESSDIERLMRPRRERIHVARNLTVAADPPPQGQRRRTGEALRVCFLSRIARKKNLGYALEVLARVEAPVVFTIYGPREDAGYWAECEALIAALAPNVSVEVAGPVPNENVREALARHDLFFLPTLGENFGHVFVEAWSAGLPVLTSDQTPWRALAEKGVGWDLPLDRPSLFADIIQRLFAAPAAEMIELRARCLSFAREHTSDEEAVVATRDMLVRVASGSSQAIQSAR